jgi:diadenosine tetraphosphate (Ap4A) HIT family hydrolase
LRAEERERELLEIMKDGCKDSSSDDVDNASSSSGLVQSLQLKIQCLTQELSEAHRLHKIESTKLGQDLTHSTHAYACVETELVNCRKLLEAEMMKRSDLEKKILELQNNFSIASDQHESELATVKNNDSDAMFILEEQNASLKCQLQDEQERIASSEEELRGKCEELCQQNKSMSMKQDALLANIDTLSQQVSTLKSKERELQVLIHQQELSASEGVAEIESRYAEQVAEHVHEQERLKLLLVESTSNFSSLSEKYSFILSTRSETETKSEELYKQKYTDVSEECSRLKRDFSDLKQIQLDASQDFASTVQKFSQAIEKLKVGHRSHVDLLETKCTDLIETLKHQQQLIESANQQQKDSTHNRAAMMSIVEDWRRKTSEAMHTILHMQHAETAMKDAFRQEKATSNQLQEALQAKDSEITHLWELVVTLSKEVEQTTHKSEHLAKSIESWNSSHDFDSQLHVEVIPEVKSEDEDASPDSSDSSTLVKYAAIAKMFPSSPENRSNKYEHLNIPKILVDGLNSSCGVGVKLVSYSSDN